MGGRRGFQRKGLERVARELATPYQYLVPGSTALNHQQIWESYCFLHKLVSCSATNNWIYVCSFPL